MGDKVKRAEMHRSEGDEHGNELWYFDCKDFYVDVEKDEAGKLSVFLRNRKTGRELWVDEADIRV